MFVGRMRRWLRHSPRGGFHGLDGLDRRLAKWVDFDAGFFVEAGANDGIAQSNTHYFEQRRGWRGVLIEPIPELAARCQQNRPRAKVVSCALGSFAQDGSTVRMSYCNLMSLVRGAMGSAERDDAHLAAGRQVQGIGASYEIEVPCRALSNVLSELFVRHVDLLSLDVEGYEANVLQGLDFEQLRPTWVLVEARRPDEIRALLSPCYEEASQLSHHDYLFRARP